MLNRHQPIRPRFDPSSNQPLLYSTMPKKDQKRKPKVCTYPARVAQMRLYRAARRGDIPSVVAIGELYSYLFDDLRSLVNKTHLGNAVMPSLIYEPRVFKNVKSLGGPMMTYVFRHPLELQYGLEWQICVWLRRFLNQGRPAHMHVSGPEEMERELDAIADGADYEDDLEFHMEEPLWDEILLNVHEWEPPHRQREAAPEREKPRDLSV